LKASRLLKKPASVRRPLFGFFGLSRLFGWLSEMNQINKTNQMNQINPSR
jgi:hypothetical protein